MKLDWARLLILILSLGIAGCTVEEADTAADGNGVGPTYQGPAETAYCSTVNTFSTPVTVTGTAVYNARIPYSGVERLGSADPSAGVRPAEQRPIRRAEVRVTDGSGAVVQCGETLADGTFSITLPAGSTTYYISVNSRAYNSHLRASVLNRTEQNKFYSLTAVTTGVAGSVGTLTAPANGTVLGGAFNILDQLLNANEFLVNKVGSCGFTGCSNFSASTSTKVTAYWEKGFNPNSYFGNSSSGLSFYLPGYSRLFILGGINGDTDNTDTDHFDNSIILHEYGHFLEDSEFVSDSPGGSHSGDGIIDPRLAWSEGWGNFFQAAVQDYVATVNSTSYTPRYIDTYGNEDGTTRGNYFFWGLENQASGQDTPIDPGEGNFREFSITRMLWDAIDSATDSGSESVSNQFANIWAVLTKSSRGFQDSLVAFRNVGYFHLAQMWIDTNNGGADWSALRTLEKQGDTSNYGQYVTTAACSSPPTYSYLISPVYDTSTQTRNSNLFKNNRFYHLRITSAGVQTIRLEYDNASGTAQADLDLYIYNESARFANASDLIVYNVSDPVGSGTSQTVDVSTSLPVGDYLINVLAYTGTVSPGNPVPYTVNFNLKLNGARLCPANIVQ